MKTPEDRGDSAADDDALTADTVFDRLDQLRELLRLTDYLREFRPSPATGSTDPESNESGEADP